MTEKIEGQPSKRYWLMNISDSATPLDTFDDLEKAIAYAGGLRDAPQYVIREHGRKIVWPPNLAGQQ